MCTNCGKPRHAQQADASAFRCFHCGALTTTDGSDAAPASATAATCEPSTAPNARAAPAVALRLTPAQIRVLQASPWSLGLVLALLPIVAASAFITYLLLPFRALNPAYVVPLCFAPVALLISSAGLLGSLVRTRRSAFESIWAALAPARSGAMPRCHGCGHPLASARFLERCAACGSDNLAEPRITQRAAKTDAALDRDARRLEGEIDLRHDALRTAIRIARTSHLALPTLALAAALLSSWSADWKLLLPFTGGRFAVLTSPNCNVVVRPAGEIRNGHVGSATSLRGSWVQRDTFPVTYNRLLWPADFVHMKAFTPGHAGSGEIVGAYRTLKDPEIKVRIRTGDESADLALLTRCIDEARPYRTLAASSRPAPARRASAQRTPTVDPSLQMWTRPTP